MKVKDERLENLRNKIGRETYFLTIYLIALSIVIKKFVHGPELSGLGSEFLILIISGVYYAVRYWQMGILADEVEVHDRSSRLPMSTKNVVVGLGAGVIISLIFGLRSAVVYASTGQEKIFYFFLVFLAAFMIYIPVFLVLALVLNLASRKGGESN